MNLEKQFVKKNEVDFLINLRRVHVFGKGS